MTDTDQEKNEKQSLLAKVFGMRPEDLRRMRKDANLDQESLALLMYEDAKKRLRISKIERGEVMPNFFEGLSWFKHCAVGSDRTKVIKALDVLGKASKGES